MLFKKILLLGGTTEGRILCHFLKDKPVELWVSVATDYGKEMIEQEQAIKLLNKRLDKEAMIALLQAEKFDVVLDATHPYARLVTENIREATLITRTAYKRIIRTTYKAEPSIKQFKTVEEIVSFLNDTSGNILLTTGSKDLPCFTHLKDYKERVYVRMLPVAKTIEDCLEMGFKRSHLICMQGPFSDTMNRATLEHMKGTYMVTKDSGDIGGFQEKIASAKAMGVMVILLERPQEEIGLTLEETYRWLEGR